MRVMVDLPEFRVRPDAAPGQVVETPAGPAYLFVHGISEETVGQPFLFTQAILADLEGKILDTRNAPRALTGIRGATWFGRGLLGSAVL